MMSGGQMCADIAVIGMACRLPDASSPDEFWSNVRQGVESIRRLTDDELIAAGVRPDEFQRADFVRMGSVLEDPSLFDAAFFGFSPRDAAIMDPQHRLFLECSWEALERAGHTAERFSGRIGVYGGAGAHLYLPQNLLKDPELLEDVGFFLLRHTGNDKDFLTTRVSYCLNLTGPSVNVQTACSTSLVAVHLACQGLLAGECDMALAGGVTIELPHKSGYRHRPGEILSPDGHCRAFDARAEGTVFGSGAGIVVLRRLEDALASGDYVHAVVKGTAVNNDGSSKVGYLAPSVGGQAQAVAEALSVAGVDPATVGYIEAHGTGTPIGDAIEIAALTDAFRRRTARRGFCAIGSVKTNIGHLDTAAGVAGLIKTVQALEHREIPPSLHFETPSPSSELESSPFFVSDRLRPWRVNGTPLRAGVNSLGVGGTNAHAVLEEAPPRPRPGPSRPWQLLLLSARTPTALEMVTDQLVDHLRDHPEAPLPDVAFTLSVGRKHFQHRRILLGNDAQACAAAVESRERQEVLTGKAAAGPPAVTFMFAGGGAQYAGMGAELYRLEASYREAVDECLELLGADDLVTEIARALRCPADQQPSGANRALERPAVGLPALFIAQYAHAKLWMSWGVRPQSLIGHSMGEYTAATVAGIFSLRDALALVIGRGRLFERVAPGGMTAINLPADELIPLLGPDLSVAAVNGASLSVASGPVGALDRLERTLTRRGAEFRRVHVDVAAHSAMLDPILPEFRELLRGRTLGKPNIPLISGRFGSWLDSGDANDPDYWVRQLRETVRFSEGLQELLADPSRILLEVGPGRTLTSLARQHPGRRSTHTVVPSMPHADEEWPASKAMLTALGQLWATGVDFDIEAFYRNERRQRLPLPTYPFERESYWIEPKAAEPARVSPQAEAASDEPARSPRFYRPAWRSIAIGDDPEPAAAAPRKILLFQDRLGLAAALEAELRAIGVEVATVLEGSTFERMAPGRYGIDPGAQEDYDRLIDALVNEGAAPSHVVHLWSVTGQPSRTPAHEARAERERGYESLLCLSRSLARTASEAEPRAILMVSDGAQQVAGEPVYSPAKALLIGAVPVASAEYPALRCRSVDIRLPPEAPWRWKRLAKQLAAEVRRTSPTIVALRGHDRFVQDFRRAEIVGPTENARLRSRGVYLITGGLGGLGLLLARHLTRSVSARVVLVGRTSIPARTDWTEWVTSHSSDDHVSRAIRAIREIEDDGGEVLVVRADVTDRARMAEVLGEVRASMGEINGVIHAAGVLRDQLIEFQRRDDADAVIGPKLEGALVLDELLGDTPLDFFVLFSSISAMAGLPGQAAYAAANAFLDSFAAYRAARRESPTVSIAWSAWRGVGMMDGGAGADGARWQKPGGLAAASISPAGEHGASETIVVRLDDRHDWVLSEHRLRGGPSLLPGAAFLEHAARAVRGQAPAFTPVELTDVFFLAPFLVQQGSRELRIRINRCSGDRARLSFLGADAGGAGESLREHAQAYAIELSETTARRVQVAELLREFPDRADLESAATHSHLEFGQRWENITEIHIGRGQAVLRVALPTRFTGDLEKHPLHPALLDSATAGARALLRDACPGPGFFVPVACARARFLHRVPQTFYSHVRCRPGRLAERDMVLLDIDLLDEDGWIFGEIEGFLLRRMSDSGALTALASQPDRADAAVPEADEDTISVEQGMAAFSAIAAWYDSPHVVATTRELAVALRDLRTRGEKGAARGVATRPKASLRRLGQVESVLARHDGVQEAVVVERSGEGKRRVVAYVIPDRSRFTTVSDLRRYAKSELAKSLAPAQYVELDTWPRTTSGVLDLGALPDPFASEDTYVAPRTAVERELAALWREVLGCERVGVHDNFFDLGGHSLLAVRVITRAEGALGLRLGLDELVLQTLEQLAARSSEQPSATAAPVTV